MGEGKEARQIKGAMEGTSQAWLNQQKKTLTKQDYSAHDNKVVAIELDKIAPHPLHPRPHPEAEAVTQMASSISTHGLHYPVLLTVSDDGYYILDGIRKLRAFEKLKRPTIPAFILGPLSDIKAMAVMLTLDGNHEQLGPIERTFAYQKLMETLDINQTDLAKFLGVARTTVTTCVNFRTKLCGAIVEHCLDHKVDLDYTHFRSLTKMAWYPNDQWVMFQDLLENHWSSRELDVMVNTFLEEQHAMPSTSGKVISSGPFSTSIKMKGLTIRDKDVFNHAGQLVFYLFDIAHVPLDQQEHWLTRMMDYVNELKDTDRKARLA
jgi:ParB family chromosome partitioning protein